MRTGVKMPNFERVRHATIKPPSRPLTEDTHASHNDAEEDFARSDEISDWVCAVDDAKKKTVKFDD